jgi:hypothetical protein
MMKNWSFLLFFNFHVGAAAPTPMTIPPPMGGAAPMSGAGGVCPSGGGAGEQSRSASGGAQRRAGVRHGQGTQMSG